MISVVLIDDERPALDELAYQLEQFDQINILAKYTDPLVALKEMTVETADAVFLDIDMPILNGLSLATELLEQNPNLFIIFITAYSEYALQAFEVNAVDYIVKPVRRSRLNQTVEKLKKNKENGSYFNNQILQQLSVFQSALTKSPEKLVVFDGENYHFIGFNEVIYIEAQTKYMSVVTIHGTYTARKTMNDMEGQLKSRGFFRCHRSYMINPEHITKITRLSYDTFQIELSHSFTVPVSKPHMAEVRHMIEQGK